MNPEIKINKPTRLNTPYLHYQYVVYYCEIGDTRRKKRFFTTKTQAERFYLEKLEELTAQANTAAQQNADDILGYRRASACSAKLGIPLLQLAKQYAQYFEFLNCHHLPNLDVVFDEYIKWRRENNPNITLGTAVENFIRKINTDKLHRPATIKSFTNFIARVVEYFGADTPLVYLTSKRIEQWLIGLCSIKWKCKEEVVDISAATKYGYLCILRSFFTYCRRSGYIAATPIDNVILPAPILKEPRAYTVDEIKGAILSTKPRSCERLYVCIAAFAGIRPAEIGRLKWSHIDIAERQIRLSSDVTKMQYRRNIYIQDNLLAWLNEWKDKFGKDELVIPRLQCVQYNFLKWFKRAGFHVIHDGLRHSFGSYLYALLGDANRVIEQMGHSIQVFRQHYMDLVRKEDAQKFFAITPSAIKD